MEATSPLPKVGQYLYASCAGEDYGQIIAVGQDENAAPTVDIEVYNPDDLLSYDDDINPLTELELPKGTTVILRKLQYELKGDGYIECKTPGNNCYRCTKFFKLQDKRTKWNR